MSIRIDLRLKAEIMALYLDEDKKQREEGKIFKRPDID